jgi:hypothetical protein
MKDNKIIEDVREQPRMTENKKTIIKLIRTYAKDI